MATLGQPTKYTPEKVAEFLEALSRRGIAQDGCDAADICRMTAYNWRKKHTEFRRLWNKARKVGRDNLRRLLWDLAEGKVDKKEGKIIAPNVAIFLAKITLPEYRRVYQRTQDDKTKPEEIANAVAALCRGALNTAPLVPETGGNGHDGNGHDS